MCVSKDNNPFLLNRLQTQAQAQQSFTNTPQWLLCLQALFWLCLPRVSSAGPFQCVPLLSRELWFTLTRFFTPHSRLLLGNNPLRCTWFLMSPPNLSCPFCHGQTKERLKSWSTFNQNNRDVEGWTWWFWSCFPTLMIPWFDFFRFTPCLPVNALSLEGFCIVSQTDTLSHSRHLPRGPWQSYSQVFLCAGLGLSLSLEMLFKELSLPCLRVLELCTSSTEGGLELKVLPRICPGPLPRTLGKCGHELAGGK